MHPPPEPVAPPGAAGRRRLPTFAALSHRNYRLWFLGQLTSLFGTWMQSTAQGYLVYQLTQSAAWLGYVGFAAGAATWVFTLYGGVIADRVPRRGLLVTTQAAAMLLAVVLSILTFTGAVVPWHVLVLAFLLGVVNAFDMPARQSFVLEMVSREHLTNAIALNATMFNMATALGPAVGGLVYAALGPGWCFTLNAASFLAVIAALLAMKLARSPAPLARIPVWRGIGEAVRAIRDEPRILAIIVLIGLVNLFALSLMTLLPAWAVGVLHGDATTNGLLQSARGIGALVAALAIATLATARGRGMALTVGTFALPLALFAVSLTRTLPLSLLGLFFVGVALIVVFNLANSLVQTMVPDAVRGRVMGIYVLAMAGMLPIGSLAFGALAEVAGEPLAVAAGAAATLACAIAVFAAVPSLRRTD